MHWPGAICHAQYQWHPRVASIPLGRTAPVTRWPSADGQSAHRRYFTLVQQHHRPRLPVWIPDGSVDPTLRIRSLALTPLCVPFTVQPDGMILSVGPSRRIRMPQLPAGRSRGALDTSFLDGLLRRRQCVYAITLQPDGKIIAVGDFTVFNGVTPPSYHSPLHHGRTIPTIQLRPRANSLSTRGDSSPTARSSLAWFPLLNGEPALTSRGSMAAPSTAPGMVEFTPRPTP